MDSSDEASRSATPSKAAVSAEKTLATDITTTESASNKADTKSGPVEPEHPATSSNQSTTTTNEPQTTQTTTLDPEMEKLRDMAFDKDVSFRCFLDALKSHAGSNAMFGESHGGVWGLFGPAEAADEKSQGMEKGTDVDDGGPHSKGSPHQ